MALKVLVHKKDETAPPDSFVFQQERITIGRDQVNDLFLQDVDRLVSKEHAEIVTSGATIHLTDLGSKNFTYLNGERLQSGRPYPVEPRDTIQIGEFEITVDLVDAAPSPRPPSAGEDRTVFDASFMNPFEDSAKLLAVALRSLSKRYDVEAPSRRDDALEQALSAAMEGDVDHGVYQRVARRLAPEAVAPPLPVASPFPPPPVAPPAEGGRLRHLVDTLLQSMARLIGVPWRFRHEFIGQTIMQPEETAFLYEGNAEMLKGHLLDPSLSEEEAAHRMRLLGEAVEEVELHQVAMLDGYKAGVREGAVRLIDQLHPDALEQEAAQGKLLYRLFPPLAKAEALRRLREQLRELRAEDWKAAEQRTYRPAFIKAYLARMTAARRQEPHPRGR